MSELFGPFDAPPPPSVQLQNAPLARVLCQVRWPELTRLLQEFEQIALAVGADLADDYPLFGRRHEANFVLGPNGISQSPGAVVFQWSTADSRFHVHFGHNFVTVETQKYTNKEELIGRLGRVLDVIARHVAIPKCIRLGYRYTNRVTADIDIRPLIRSEVRGGEAVPTRDGVEALQSVTETLYRVDEDLLLARWAQLPAGASVDPTLEALQIASWVLDLDAYHESPISFASRDITDFALRLAGRGYTFFRWSVTEEFLKTFGRRDD